MKTIRGGSGLGDSIYVQAIARHLARRGEELEVCTFWPDVFSTIPVITGPFRRNGIDYCAHYSMRKDRADTDQFEDCCIQAGITEPVDLKLDWSMRDTALVRRIYSYKPPYFVVAMPREPFDRGDNYGIELFPKMEVLQSAIDALDGTIIQIGKGEPSHRLTGIDLDLSNETTVHDLFDIASAAHGFIGQVSYIIPLAESFYKPVLIIWSKEGTKSNTRFIRLVRPEKVLHRDTSVAIMDNCSSEQLKAAVDGFYRTSLAV